MLRRATRGRSPDRSCGRRAGRARRCRCRCGTAGGCPPVRRCRRAADDRISRRCSGARDPSTNGRPAVVRGRSVDRRALVPVAPVGLASSRRRRSLDLRLWFDADPRAGDRPRRRGRAGQGECRPMRGRAPGGCTSRRAWTATGSKVSASAAREMASRRASTLRSVDRRSSSSGSYRRTSPLPRYMSCSRRGSSLGHAPPRQRVEAHLEHRLRLVAGPGAASGLVVDDADLACGGTVDPVDEAAHLERLLELRRDRRPHGHAARGGSGPPCRSRW